MNHSRLRELALVAQALQALQGPQQQTDQSNRQLGVHALLGLLGQQQDSAQSGARNDLLRQQLTAQQGEATATNDFHQQQLAAETDYRKTQGQLGNTRNILDALTLWGQPGQSPEVQGALEGLPGLEHLGQGRMTREAEQIAKTKALTEAMTRVQGEKQRAPADSRVMTALTGGVYPLVQGVKSFAATPPTPLVAPNAAGSPGSVTPLMSQLFRFFQR